MPSLEDRVAAVRRFNRFYTRQIGVLTQRFLESPWSLAEVRLLYELAHGDRPTAAELGRALGLDPGYLSRMLRDFQRRGFLDRRRSATDARQRHLSLTARGRAAFATLDRRQRKEVAALIGRLTDGQQRRLTQAMDAIAQLLGVGPTPPAPYLLRPHEPGDLGWVVHRHGALYAQEYGWDTGFEALVAQIVARFIQRFDPARERCWIAERDGDIVGSVFLVGRSKTVAQLRLLLVEPSARGLGIGWRLVSECIRFARLRRYRKIVLWTQQNLRAARRLYERAGFRVARSGRHRSFGQHLVEETWELKL